MTEGVGRVVVVVWPGCAWQEVAPAVAMLSGAREVCVVAGSRATVRVREGYALAPDATFDDVGDHVTELVVPGGELDPVWSDAATHVALVHLAARARVVGAVCNGVPLLARAGLLAGRQVTHTCVPRYAPRPTWDALLDAVEPALLGTTFVDEDVVVDGPFVTAKPWAAVRFARALVRGLVPDADAAATTRYLAGVRDLPGVDPDERWVVTLTALPGVPTPRAVVRDHVRWLSTLEADGRLVAAGPFPEDAAGMLVLRVRDRAEALALASTDPFVTTGMRRLEVRRWLLSTRENHHLGAADG